MSENEAPDYSYDPNSGAVAQPGGYGRPGAAPESASDAPDPNPAADAETVPEDEKPEASAPEGAQTDVNQLLSDAGAPQDASVPQDGADGGDQESLEQQQGTPNEFDNAPTPEEEKSQAPAQDGAQTEVNQLLSDAGAPEDASTPQDGADGGEQDSKEQQEGTPVDESTATEEQPTNDDAEPVEAPPGANGEEPTVTPSPGGNSRTTKKKRS